MSGLTSFSPPHYHGSPSGSTGYNDYSDNGHGSTSQTQQTSPTRLKLILPPMKAGKPTKAAKKSSKSNKEKVKGPPRPPKLKPLKEVLGRLISQIKRKDEYGFFLEPVDASKIPGYAEAIKRPMDLGTMTSKVTRGKYRSLEDFASDVRLIMVNAKTFNPPGSLYYTEADRIEAWALEQIGKSAPTVIEFETDWNVEVEEDDDPDVAIDDGTSTGRGTPAVEAGPEEVVAGSGRKVIPRFATARTDAPPVKDPPKTNEMKASLDVEGHLPGYRDGVGQFPPDSEWASVMLDLKLKNKQYKTKKERLRIEKEGLPHLSDGSLHFWEVQDPFTVLADLLPDPVSLPQLNPLCTPSAHDTAQLPLPGPITYWSLPSLAVPRSQSRATSTLPRTDSTTPSAPPITPSASTSTFADAPKRKYFTITRTAPTRGSIAAATRTTREDTAEPLSAAASMSTSRPPHTLDYGSYGLLPGLLAQAGGVSISHAAAALSTDERMRAYIRAALEAENPTSSPSSRDKVYWTDARARDAAEHIRDAVHGGIDGFAYARSVAEFVGTPSLIAEDESAPAPTSDASYPLGKPLSAYVHQTVVEPLTGGRLRVVQAAQDALANPGGASPELRKQIEASTLLHPHLATIAALLRRMGAQPADMADLIRPTKRPREGGVEGGAMKKRKGEEGEGIEENGKVKTEDDDVNMDEPEDKLDTSFHESQPEDASVQYDLSDSSGIARALTFVADSLVAYEHRRKSEARTIGSRVKTEGDGGGAVAVAEDETLRRARICLLALARVAPSTAVSNVPPIPTSSPTDTPIL